MSDGAKLERLEQLVRAICGTGEFEGVPHDRRMSEFTMSIPAREDRDADILISWAVQHIRKSLRGKNND